jgi:16S rRNA (adenine1518-N6/adenine1519-N6)-dimethyltransferase
MKLSEMRQLLTDRDIQLTKSLGQNFLHDANQLRRIVQAAELKKSDKVLEIGPGLGPLTELLVAEAGEVLAIEKDGRLVEVLREQFKAAPPTSPSTPAEAASISGSAPVLQLLYDDALDFIRRKRRDWSQWKLVANLPYSVASPILVELAQAQRGPQRMVITLQMEVAKRLTAPPDGKDYGLLTLLVQLEYEPLSWFKIPGSCFFPEPEVGSACVCLAQRSPGLLPPEQHKAYARIVKRAFSQRRKMMLKLLKADWALEDLNRAFETLGLSPMTRAEAVSLEQFVGLTRLLAK